MPERILFVQCAMPSQPLQAYPLHCFSSLTIRQTSSVCKWHLPRGNPLPWPRVVAIWGALGRLLLSLHQQLRPCPEASAPLGCSGGAPALRPEGCKARGKPGARLSWALTSAEWSRASVHIAETYPSLTRLDTCSACNLERDTFVR